MKKKTDVLRLGIVGTGMFTRGSHLPVIRSLAGIRVRALCDTDERALEQARAMVGPETQTFTRYQELVALPDLDAILVRAAIPGSGLCS